MLEGVLGWVNAEPDPQGPVAGSGVVPGIFDAIRGAGGAVAQGATNAALGQFPGYGSIWTYDAQDGLEVTARGGLILGAAAAAVVLLLIGGR